MNAVLYVSVVTSTDFKKKWSREDWDDRQQYVRDRHSKRTQGNDNRTEMEWQPVRARKNNGEWRRTRETVRTQELKSQAFMCSLPIVARQLFDPVWLSCECAHTPSTRRNIKLTISRKSHQHLHWEKLSSLITTNYVSSERKKYGDSVWHCISSQRRLLIQLGLTSSPQRYFSNPSNIHPFLSSLTA